VATNKKKTSKSPSKNNKKVISKPASKKVPAKKAQAKKSQPKKSVPQSKATPKASAKKLMKSSTVGSFKASAKTPAVAMKKIDLKNFVTPLDDRLIVQTAEKERKTAGGLYIPDTAADVSGNFEGQVIAAGRGHRDPKGRVRPMDVGVGDRVIFSQYAGAKLEIQGQEVLILRESDVMGILDKNF
jgi:chaperonin GroES